MPRDTIDLTVPIRGPQALVVATIGIVGSFALAWPLVTRTPPRRIL
jgi:hypothetical protein